MLYPCHLAGELFLNIKLLLFCLIVLVVLKNLCITPMKRKRVPSSKAAAGASDSPPKQVNLCMDY